MESKTMKYFDILFEMCKSDFERRPEAVETGLKKLMDLDHSQFLEVWEYVCTRYDGLLTNPYCSPAMTANVFAALAKKSEVRAAKLSENAFLFRTLWTVPWMTKAPSRLVQRTAAPGSGRGTYS